MDAFAFPLAVYSAQILLVVAACATISAIVKVHLPQFRLIYWRLVLVICLLLPLAPARIVEVDVAAGAAMSAAVTAGWKAVTAVDPVTSLDLVMWLLIGGMLARALWLILGLIRLRSLRAGGAMATLPADLAILHRTLAPAADVRWHDRIGQPVTFGLRRPVILLPLRVRELSPDLQQAVLCHELLHAGRRDWRSTLGEELVLTVFWFHPAMWWVVARIQLCREETIDAIAVSITASRRLYMQALMAFAEPSGPTPLLAPRFAHRRQLVIRIKQLSREVVMSPSRIVFTAGGLLAVLAVSGWTVVSALPVRTELRAKSAVNRAATDKSLPAASQVGTSPTQPPGVPRPQITYRPAPPPPPPPPPPAPPDDGKTSPRVISQTKPEYPREALPYGIAANVWVSVTIDASGQVSAAKAARFQLTIDRSIDDPNYWANKPERPFLEAAESAVLSWKFEPPDANTRTSIEVMCTFRNVPGLAPAPIAGQYDAISPNGHKVLRVGGGIGPPQRIVDVKPEYPEAALAQNVQGTVILELRIGVDGSVAEVRVLRSIPPLDGAAVAAARQWQYRPVWLNGEPVEVIMTATVNFVR